MRSGMRHPSGISTIELVLLLTIVSVVAICSVSAMTKSMNKPFDSLATVLNESGQDASATEEPTSVSFWSTVPLSAWAIGIGLVSIAVLCFRKPDRKKATRKAIVSQLHEMLALDRDADFCSSRLAEKRNLILNALLSNAGRHDQATLTVREIMSTSISYCLPDQSMTRVVQQMKGGGTRHMLVCDGGGLVGVISDRDLNKPDARTAADLMTRNPLTVNEDHNVKDAINIMISNRISFLPVVCQRKVVGVISTTDVAVTLHCILTLFGNLLWTGGNDPASTATATLGDHYPPVSGSGW